MSLISIITPCYNAAEFIADTIESVAAQTYPHIEHIVVDDCSGDGSWEVIRSYGEQVQAVRLERNRGGSHARNRGAELARGRYLMFLDADDVITPETVAALVDALRDHPDSIAFCDWVSLERVDGQWVQLPREVSLPDSDTDLFRGWLERRWGCPPCAVLWHRDAYERVGGWDEGLAVEQDTDVMLRAIVEGVRLRPAAGGLALYRRHGDARISVCNDVYSERRILSQVRVLGKLLAKLDLGDDLGEYAQPVGMLYHQLSLLAFQQGRAELGRECLRKGERYAGRREVSKTLAGRLLARVFGIEQKEKITQTLAAWGIMTGRRRRFVELQRSRAGSAAVAGSPEQN
ncbi:MAG: glycosyltransferase [Gemmatimonadetes bacterium]|nr:glycosyltransferase [Gemmatimonadota bacterium]